MIQQSAVISANNRQWLVDDVQNGAVYLRPVVRGVAYWPGVRVSVAEVERQIDEAGAVCAEGGGAIDDARVGIRAVVEECKERVR